MENDLSGYRKEYRQKELLENDLPDNPIQLFQTWFYEAENIDSHEANAMTLSTIGIDNFPRSRVVLLKKYYEEGFIFFTNYESDKGKSIEVNPNVCLSFFWATMERQVIIKGVAEKVDANISDNYFHLRPKGSQLGAIVSRQSEVIVSRDFLENKLQELENKYKDKDVPRPNNWGGYLVRPISIEFWQGRPNRLHDRIKYTISGLDWKIERLAP
jgi:pyridoxamine 5'-phosphate oxidase